MANDGEKYGLGLVLSGGGAKGMVHAGMLQYFKEEGIKIDVIAGASVGALVGAMYGAGHSPQDIRDFFTNTTGKGDLRDELLSQVAFPSVSEKKWNELVCRNLLLNCITIAYADLWRKIWRNAFRNDNWTKEDFRLIAETDFADLTDTWKWEIPLRTRYARRQALVEIDVLSAQALGLTLDELQTIYRVQFPVLRKYEQKTWYDQNGRIIYTKNRGLPGMGLSSREFDKVRDLGKGETVEQTIEDDTQPGGPVERTIVYEAPFDCCDREEDYATAWAAFESRE
jgi:preprotein translocase subunit Sec61beta